MDSHVSSNNFEQSIDENNIFSLQRYMRRELITKVILWCGCDRIIVNSKIILYTVYIMDDSEKIQYIDETIKKELLVQVKTLLSICSSNKISVATSKILWTY